MRHVLNQYLAVHDWLRFIEGYKSLVDTFAVNNISNKIKSHITYNES